MVCSSFSAYSLSVFNSCCEGSLPLEIEIWQNDAYSTAFQKNLSSAIEYIWDDSCAIISSDDLSTQFMIFFNHDYFGGEATVKLYGKGLVCEQMDCEKNPPVALLYDSDPNPCADNRNPFCSAPTKCEFAGMDSARDSFGEKGCKFYCKCATSSCYGSRFALVLSTTAMKEPGLLELCGLSFNWHQWLTSLPPPQSCYHKKLNLLPYTATHIATTQLSIH